MKYILNEGYNGDVLTSQDGKIFKKDKETEVKKPSFEVEQYIKQKYIIPVTKEMKKIKKEEKELNKKKQKINESNEIKKPKGVSTNNSDEINKEKQEADNSNVDF